MVKFEFEIQMQVCGTLFVFSLKKLPVVPSIENLTEILLFKTTIFINVPIITVFPCNITRTDTAECHCERGLWFSSPLLSFLCSNLLYPLCQNSSSKSSIIHSYLMVEPLVIQGMKFKRYAPWNLQNWSNIFWSSTPKSNLLFLLHIFCFLLCW